MIKSLSETIVHRRKTVFLLYILLACVSIFTINKVNINYDFTAYLSKDTQTRKSLELMEREFGSTETISIMLTNAKDGEADELVKELSTRKGVLIASHDASADVKTIDGTRYDRITLFLDDVDAIAFYTELEKDLDAKAGMADHVLGGSAPQTIKLQNKIASEIPIAMLIAVLVVLAVLLFTSHSFLEPLVFAVVIVVSILINMGTNFVFGTISFITFAVCAILQLALAMDYSIMLLHSFFEIGESVEDDRQAMMLALERTFMPISSSALTTVSGLVSLMFMSFTIGFDIGMVLSKGILITMICVFTLMPAVILLFSKPLKRFRHKPIPLGGRRLGALANKRGLRAVVMSVLLCAVLAAALMQSSVRYTFTDAGINAQSDSISKVYGSANSVVVLLPSQGTREDYELQKEYLRRIGDISHNGKSVLKNAAGMVTTGDAAIKTYTAEEVHELLSSMAPNGFPFGIEAIAGFLKSSGYEDGISAQALLEMADSLSGTFLAMGLMGEEQKEWIKESREAIVLAKRMFESESFSRLILTLDVPIQGEGSEEVMEQIISVTEELYPGKETGITGLMMSVYDISHAFNADLMRVSLITILAIFLIVLFSFRNAVIPVILLLAIQGAVWINFALSVPANRDVFFMCYLICLAIQMGATIDYGILLTNNYVYLRRNLVAPGQAVEQAMELSFPTIITSGLILFFAGLTIGKLCTVYYIYSIGLLIASGTIFSLIMVLLLLPALLVSLDRFILRRKN